MATTETMNATVFHLDAEDLELVQMHREFMQNCIDHAQTTIDAIPKDQVELIGNWQAEQAYRQREIDIKCTTDLRCMLFGVNVHSRILITGKDWTGLNLIARAAEQFDLCRFPLLPTTPLKPNVGFVQPSGPNQVTMFLPDGTSQTLQISEASQDPVHEFQVWLTDKKNRFSARLQQCRSSVETEYQCHYCQCFYGNTSQDHVTIDGCGVTCRLDATSKQLILVGEFNSLVFDEMKLVPVHSVHTFEPGQLYCDLCIFFLLNQNLIVPHFLSGKENLLLPQKINPPM